MFFIERSHNLCISPKRRLKNKILSSYHKIHLKKSHRVATSDSGSNDHGQFPVCSFPPPPFPFISFKVNRQSEAACHRCFVYSDKIAAFIVCQINLKKQTRRGRNLGGREERRGGKKKKKQQQQQHTPL